MTHSTWRPGLALAALAVSAMISACSSSAATTGAPSACSVVTKAEAAAALGQPVTGPHVGTAVDGGPACGWWGPDVGANFSPKFGVGDIVRVVLAVGPNAKKFFDDFRRNSPGGRWISGLGDKAFYDGFAFLSVLKGDAYVRIYCGLYGSLSKETTLARDALSRL